MLKLAEYSPFNNNAGVCTLWSPDEEAAIAEFEAASLPQLQPQQTVKITGMIANSSINIFLFYTLVSALCF